MCNKILTRSPSSDLARFNDGARITIFPCSGGSIFQINTTHIHVRSIKKIDNNFSIKIRKTIDLIYLSHCNLRSLIYFLSF